MGEKERGIKQLKNSKELIACSQTTDDVDENSEDHNSIKKNKRVNILWWYDSIDMEANNNR